MSDVGQRLFSPLSLFLFPLGSCHLFPLVPPNLSSSLCLVWIAVLTLLVLLSATCCSVFTLFLWLLVSPSSSFAVRLVFSLEHFLQLLSFSLLPLPVHISLISSSPLFVPSTFFILPYFSPSILLPILFLYLALLCPLLFFPFFLLFLPYFCLTSILPPTVNTPIPCSLLSCLSLSLLFLYAAV